MGIPIPTAALLLAWRPQFVQQHSLSLAIWTSIKDALGRTSLPHVQRLDLFTSFCTAHVCARERHTDRATVRAICVGKDRDAAQKPSQVWSLFTIHGLKMKKMKQILLLRYDTRCYFNVRSKADISRLNLPHGDDN